MKSYILVLLSLLFSGFIFAQPGSNFPTSVDTPQSLTQATNNYTARLASSITSSSTSIPIYSPSGTLNNYSIVVIGSEEIQICSSTPTILTVCFNGRGVDGTTAMSHLVNAEIQAPITASNHNILTQAIINTENFIKNTNRGSLMVYSQSVTNATSTTISSSTHGLGSNIIVSCIGIAECGQVNVDSSGNSIITSIVPWTGSIQIVSGPLAINLPFGSTTTLNSNWPTFPFADVIAMSCYDSSGNQFGSGDITLNPHQFGISGIFNDTDDLNVVLSASNSLSGRCVIIGE